MHDGTAVIRAHAVPGEPVSRTADAVEEECAPCFRVAALQRNADAGAAKGRICLRLQAERLAAALVRMPYEPVGSNAGAFHRDGRNRMSVDDLAVHADGIDGGGTRGTHPGGKQGDAPFVA